MTVSSGDGVHAARIVVFPVHNMGYPRNARIRAFLTNEGFHVHAIHRGTPTGSTPFGKVRAIVDLFRFARGADAVLLSEMSLPYAGLTWVASRLNGAVHIVDGFIGMYETVVEDKRKVRPGSPAAGLMKALDFVAAKSADIYLTDTELRAAAIRDKYRSASSVLSLPVGAPEWAVWRPETVQNKGRVHRTEPLNILYYGNYIPLHGLESFVEGWASMGDPSRIRTTFIGRGDRYSTIVGRVKETGLSQYAEFYGAVPEDKLLGYIEQADIVLGIFGDSNKARTVIANKVWQGLACGKTVLTRNSEALEEIARIVPRTLVTLDTNASEISRVLEDLANMPVLPRDPSAAERLESYVRERYSTFLGALSLWSATKVSASKK